MAKFKKVFLIDDDPLTILICKKIMAFTGFATNVITANNGSEGLDKLHKISDDINTNMPDIIFLDLNMPPLNGWQFLDQFTQISNSFHPVPPVYILSSTIDPEDEKTAMLYPVVKGFISKPLTKEHLDNIT